MRLKVLLNAQPFSPLAEFEQSLLTVSLKSLAQPGKI